MECGRRVELLAPAGNAEGFYGAVCAGADAVYLAGSRFGARAYAENFNTEELTECIRYAHLLGRRVYLTVNTLLKEGEMAELCDYLAPFYEAGLDAVIVQDLGVFRYVREYFPGLKIHVSTQMTVCSGSGASLLKDMGAERIVPARELSLQELISIKQRTGMEIETFIHGAMCYCYSGQCLFSSILGGRSGNRGRCAQPCRLPYSVDAGAVKSGECYPLSLKDMCTVAHIPRLIEAGIDSFKIEGRMKRPEYAAGVTAIYRRCIDKYYELRERKGAKRAAEAYRVEKADEEALHSLYIRSGIQDGYYFRRNGREMVTLDSPAYSGSSEALLEEIRGKYLKERLKLPVSVRAVFRIGQPAEIVFQWRNIRAAAKGAPVEQAERQPVTEENIRKQLGKLGGSAFYAADMKVSLEEGCFYPLKQINELRREAAAELERKILAFYGYGILGSAQGGEDRTAGLHRSGGQQSSIVSETESGNASGLPLAGRHSVIAVETEPCNVVGLHRPGGQQSSIVSETESGNAAELPQSGQYGTSASGRGSVDGTWHPEKTKGYAFSVCTLPQLQALAGWICGERLDGPLRVYIDGGLLLQEEEEVLRLCRSLVPLASLFVALPYILREKDREYLADLYAKVKESGLFQGFLARSQDGLGFLREKGDGLSCRTDAGLYIWNGAAAEELASLADGFCLPYELTAGEQKSLLDSITQRDLTEKLSCEKIVYSRIPMMITANCLFRTVGGCRRAAETGEGRDPAPPGEGCRAVPKDSRHEERKDRYHGELKDSHHEELKDRYHGELKDSHHEELKDRYHTELKGRYHAVLKDRYHREFPVAIDCTHCTNIIYNSVPFSLHRELSRWRGRADLRMDFTLESPAEVEELLDSFLRGAPFPLKEYTTGHEKRGVE